MESVTTTVLDEGGAPQRRTTREYAYEHGDPVGRIAAERVHLRDGGGWRLHTSSTSEWVSRHLYGGRSWFAYAGVSVTRTCRQPASEAACRARKTDVRRTLQRWKPARCGRPADRISAYVLAFRQEGTGVEPGPQDRRRILNHDLRCRQRTGGQAEYRLLATGGRFQEALRTRKGIAFRTRGRSRVLHDSRGFPVRSDQWQDAQTVATTLRTFSGTTGLLRSVTKPNQAATSGSKRRTVLTYDDFGVFVRDTVTETGHRVRTRFDPATGALLERSGPNEAVTSSGARKPERESWAIDGLGRELAHSVSFDDASTGYRDYVVTRTTYDDAAAPTTIRTQRLRDVVAGNWITEETTLDGLGRPLVRRRILDGQRAAVTSYTYDGDGAVRAVDVPDPRSDDGRTVRYAYERDALGRVVSATRPDGSGVSTSYSGLQRTIREDTSDNTGGRRTEVYDALGRLTSVSELRTSDEPAVTRYRYDGHDALAAIVDADGNATTLRHDWAQHRTAVGRQGRSWRYRYDLNGNVVAAQAPVAASANAADAAVAYTYDDLDRVKTERFRDVRSGARAGALRTVRYRYDRGRNGLGRLAEILLPYGTIAYAYDARGLTVGEERAFVAHGPIKFGATQRVARAYDAQRQLTTTTWDDGQQWRRTYDVRGLVDGVDWHDQASAGWRQLAASSHSLAGQPRERTNAFGQTRTTTYDSAGRVVDDAVRVAGQTAAIAARTYTYNDAGDLVATAGQTEGTPATATYAYDAQHRLTRATGPNGYTGTFTYTRAGNIRTTDITWNGSSETRDVRYQYGNADAQAVDRLVDAETGRGYAAFDYDAAGNMVRRRTPAGPATLKWDGHQRLRSVEAGSRRETFFYDAAGTRMLAVGPDGAVRFWFGERETRFAPDGRQTHRRLHLSDGTSTVATVDNRTDVAIQYADRAQNVMLVLGRDGTSAASFLYGPFGEVVKAAGGRRHTRRFNDKEPDSVGGLRNYGFRTYDPTALRWTSADPLYRFSPERGLRTPQRLNAYTFSLNNPVGTHDPAGLEGEGEGAPDGPTDICAEDEAPTCEPGDPEPGGEAPASDDTAAEPLDLPEGETIEIQGEDPQDSVSIAAQGEKPERYHVNLPTARPRPGLIRRLLERALGKALDYSDPVDRYDKGRQDWKPPSEVIAEDTKPADTENQPDAPPPESDATRTVAKWVAIGAGAGVVVLLLPAEVPVAVGAAIWTGVTWAFL